MTEAADAPKARLSTAELCWYASGAIPGGIGVLAWNYLVFYYNQVVGLPGSYIGVAALLASVFDALTDPAVGTISDRTRSRWGRRHPYLLFSALPSALTGLGPLMAGIVIDVVGLTGKTSPDEVSEATVVTLGLAQGGVMFVFFVLAIFFISRYDLSRKRHEAILERLESGDAGQTTD